MTDLFVLALAIAGWLRLRRDSSRIAAFLFGYAALVSLVHLPFIMTSRYRVPFLDTLLVMLAAAAFPLVRRAAVKPSFP